MNKETLQHNEASIFQNDSLRYSKKRSDLHYERLSNCMYFLGLSCKINSLIRLHFTRVSICLLPLTNRLLLLNLLLPFLVTMCIVHERGQES